MKITAAELEVLQSYTAKLPEDKQEAFATGAKALLSDPEAKAALFAKISPPKPAAQTTSKNTVTNNEIASAFPEGMEAQVPTNEYDMNRMVPTKKTETKVLTQPQEIRSELEKTPTTAGPYALVEGAVDIILSGGDKEKLAQKVAQRDINRELYSNSKYKAYTDAAQNILNPVTGVSMYAGSKAITKGTKVLNKNLKPGKTTTMLSKVLGFGGVATTEATIDIGAQSFAEYIGVELPRAMSEGGDLKAVLKEGLKIAGNDAKEMAKMGVAITAGGGAIGVVTRGANVLLKELSSLVRGVTNKTISPENARLLEVFEPAMDVRRLSPVERSAATEQVFMNFHKLSNEIKQSADIYAAELGDVANVSTKELVNKIDTIQTNIAKQVAKKVPDLKIIDQSINELNTIGRNVKENVYSSYGKQLEHLATISDKNPKVAISTEVMSKWVDKTDQAFWATKDGLLITEDSPAYLQKAVAKINEFKDKSVTLPELISSTRSIYADYMTHNDPQLLSLWQVMRDTITDPSIWGDEAAREAGLLLGSYGKGLKLTNQMGAGLNDVGIETGFFKRTGKGKIGTTEEQALVALKDLDNTATSMKDTGIRLEKIFPEAFDEKGALTVNKIISKTKQALEAQTWIDTKQMNAQLQKIAKGEAVAPDFITQIQGYNQVMDALSEVPMLNSFKKSLKYPTNPSYKNEAATWIKAMHDKAPSYAAKEQWNASLTKFESLHNYANKMHRIHKIENQVSRYDTIGAIQSMIDMGTYTIPANRNIEKIADVTTYITNKGIENIFNESLGKEQSKVFAKIFKDANVIKSADTFIPGIQSIVTGQSGAGAVFTAGAIASGNVYVAGMMMMLNFAGNPAPLMKVVSDAGYKVTQQEVLRFTTQLAKMYQLADE